jgi:hypothetical protein
MGKVLEDGRLGLGRWWRISGGEGDYMMGRYAGCEESIP